MNVIVLAVVSGSGLIVNGCSKLVDLKDREGLFNSRMLAKCIASCLSE